MMAVERQALQPDVVELIGRGAGLVGAAGGVVPRGAARRGETAACLATVPEPEGCNVSPSD
jgi:hypothetical protein